MVNLAFCFRVLLVEHLHTYMMFCTGHCSQLFEQIETCLNKTNANKFRETLHKLCYEHRLL